MGEAGTTAVDLPDATATCPRCLLPLHSLAALGHAQARGCEVCGWLAVVEEVPAGLRHISEVRLPESSPMARFWNRLGKGK